MNNKDKFKKYKNIRLIYKGLYTFDCNKFVISNIKNVPNQINLLPSNINLKNINIHTVKSKFFSEKIRLLNQVIEMIEHTNKLLKDNIIDSLILFDDCKYIYKEKQKVESEGASNVYSHLSKVKSPNFFAQYVEKKLSDYSPIINLYGVPFYEKELLKKIRNLTITDFPFTPYDSFSLYDLIKQYSLFCKLNFKYSLEEFNSLQEIQLTNKYNVVTIRLVKNTSEITSDMFTKYQFIILSEGSKTEREIDLFKDEELNQFYKQLVKQHNDIYLRRA